MKRCTRTLPVTCAPVGSVAMEPSWVGASAFETMVKTDVLASPSASKIELATNVKIPLKSWFDCTTTLGLTVLVILILLNDVVEVPLICWVVVPAKLTVCCSGVKVPLLTKFPVSERVEPLGRVAVELLVTVFADVVPVEKVFDPVPFSSRLPYAKSAMVWLDVEVYSTNDCALKVGVPEKLPAKVEARTNSLPVAPTAGDPVI